MNFLKLHDCRIEHIKNLYQQYNAEVFVLRLDEIHPQVSGNKWFKLQEYLKEGNALNKKYIVTFGGAYSNHIIATAVACKEMGFRAIGIIRGEKPTQLSHTLREAMGNGMELFFISREEYKTKIIPQELYETVALEDPYIINEGGYGKKGMEGSKDILNNLPHQDYTHIICAVGTGTTLAGLVAASSSQKIIGISVTKNNMDLGDEINQLLPAGRQNEFELLHQFHFGGYAKHTVELIDFMNDWYRQTGIPSDFVYTGKLFFAADQLIKEGFIPKGSKVLIVHSGGLQGNLSLPKGTLIF